MIEIANIYATFSAKERQGFKHYLKQKNQRGDTKNLKLVGLIESGKTKDIANTLYAKPARGAYHALCKRVLDALVDFVALKSFEDETLGEFNALKLLLASRLFFERKLYKIAFKTLSKAENIALELDNFSILNEIYLTKAQYSYLNNKLSLEAILSAIKTNQKQANLELQLNLAYAKIKLELQKQPHPLISELVLTTFSEFDLEVSEALTYRSLYQLMEITATTATLRNDFYSISPFMVTLFNKIEQKGEVPEKHRLYFLRMLYLMALTEFRNKRFVASQKLIEKLEFELSICKRNYKLQFDEKLLELKVLNAIYTGAIDNAVEMLTSNSRNTLNSSLLMAMCCFQQEEFAKVYAILKKLNKTDDWYLKKIGWTWVLKKNIMEILVLIELDRVDTVLNRLVRFSRNFNKRLMALGEERVIVFMKLVEEYYEEPALVESYAFKERVEASFDWLGKEEEDIFVMSFYAWLKAKMENRKLYDTILELVAI